MPRVNLTDEEAALIERLRVKNTAATSFNEGLERARQLLNACADSIVESAGKDAIGDELVKQKLLNLEESILSERREVKL